jgi:hypothetical protein
VRAGRGGEEGARRAGGGARGKAGARTGDGVARVRAVLALRVRHERGVEDEQAAHVGVRHLSEAGGLG